MKRRKNHIAKLIADAAFVVAVTVVSRCLTKKEKNIVRRDMDNESLNRQLAMVSLVYHAIGIFYND